MGKFVRKDADGNVIEEMETTPKRKWKPKNVQLTSIARLSWYGCGSKSRSPYSGYGGKHYATGRTQRQDYEAAMAARHIDNHVEHVKQ